MSLTVKFMHLTIKKDLFKDFLSGTAQCYSDGRRLQNFIDFMQQLLNSLDHYNYPGGPVMLGLFAILHVWHHPQKLFSLQS